jgi:VWFA-related protein
VDRNFRLHRVRFVFKSTFPVISPATFSVTFFSIFLATFLAVTTSGAGAQAVSLQALFAKGGAPQIGSTEIVSTEIGAAASDVTLRSDVTEVQMAFSATDKNNHAVATMQPSDLAIVDRDVVVRDFPSFTRAAYTRLDVAVLVDASESINPQFREVLANVVQVIETTGGVPEESFSVIAFRDLKPLVICKGNCRSVSIDQSFQKVGSGGFTPLYDSIVFTADMLGDSERNRSEGHGKKVLILFSDGNDTISLKAFTDAVLSALDNEVTVYTIDVSAKPHTSRGTLVLRALSTQSGGRYFSLESGTRKLIDAILEDFHAAYVVTYKVPGHASGFHQVRILSTHDSSLQFHCRLGYYYPSNPGD